MPDPLERPTSPGRLIIPGAEPDLPVSSKSKIVLPPGTSREETAQLPEFPKLRSLVLVPFSDGKRELLLVNDPLGVMPGQPVLGIESLGLLQLLDGSLSMTDITAAVMRDSKDIRIAGAVRDFVAQLDQLLMLESPLFEAAYREIRDAYHLLEIRPAALEDRSYPAERDGLVRFLAGHFAEAARMRNDAGEREAPPDARPRAILAPHLDPRRSGTTIARALLELGPEQAGPLRVVVFGTGHALIGDTLALTRKHFETPLGKVLCDTAFVDRVASRLGGAAYRAELAHRDEHSIEFPVVYLQHRMGNRGVRIVPILCGGFHALLDQDGTPRDDETFETMIQAVRETERELGGPTVYLAGVDLSHVGTRFGDPATDERTKQDIDTKDRAALQRARTGSADAWFAAIAEHDDSTRICGLAPTYAMLRCAEPSEGRLLHYEQSDEDGGSLVSIAAMVWP
jgi:hypothetical protein